MSELIENGEGLPPGVAGIVMIAAGVVGVAETDQRLDFADAVAQVQVQFERLLVTAFGQVVLTEVVVCVAETVERCGLAVEVAEFLEQGEGSAAVRKSSVVVSE
ncbi:hypothetical protein HD593_004968 [Nonomuraea rubra]|uniref:Uncharacterized protein n=1 Tax=Nonomuraea rubra TaxID=46180 RepID=A0A7X0NV35_9ACTN|nr:hypothetical protein [Nonomuraea rubra]MBB6550173.1 hypothetical protein [Nonomuraea rubra]